MLHYVDEIRDDAQVRSRDRIRDIDRHFSGSFSYVSLAPGEELSEAETQFPPGEEDAIEGEAALEEAAATKENMGEDEGVHLGSGAEGDE